MKNPKIFSQCDPCCKYNAGISQGRGGIELIRKEIRKKIDDLFEYHNPQIGIYWNKYNRCGECYENRLKEAGVPKNHSEEKKKDIEFLSSIGIEPKSVL